MVRNCIESILKGMDLQQHLSQIVLIDDASTDENLLKYLQECSKRPKFVLLRNEVNRGFTSSVNLGMMFAKSDDVLLLNSDTIVYEDWLCRLRAVLFHLPNIASVCPLTRHSHLTSYPNGLNDLRLDISDRDIDRLASEVNEDNYVEIYSNVGFCMLINRDCLDEIGYFDEENFPRGYGEETDFCLRAADMRWKHYVAGNVFVTHFGEQSFRSEKKMLVANMLEKFKELHPNFHEIEEHHRKSNPLASVRKNIDLVRFRESHSIRKNFSLRIVSANQADLKYGQFIYDPWKQKIFLNLNLQYEFPNILPYQVPDELEQFVSDLKLSGVKEISCSHDLLEIFNETHKIKLNMKSF